MEIVRKIVKKIEEHQLYLLDKVTEKLSSLVEANRMKPGVGEGRFRTAKRGNKMFLLAFKKQGDRLLETALRLDFFHPEVINTALLTLTRICYVKF